MLDELLGFSCDHQGLELFSQILRVKRQDPTFSVGILTGQVSLFSHLRVDRSDHPARGREEVCPMLSPVERAVGGSPCCTTFPIRGASIRSRGPRSLRAKSSMPTLTEDPCFDLDPGVSLVEIVPLGDRDPLHLQDFHRPHHGMDGVFVVKVLIEFASAAMIVVGARLGSKSAPLSGGDTAFGRGSALSWPECEVLTVSWVLVLLVRRTGSQ